MHNILITSAGQRVSLVRAFQQELKKINPSGKVYTVDLNPKLAPACHISDGYKSISRVIDEGYIQQLLEICREWEVKIVIPTIDTELQVLSKNKQLFLDNGIILVVSDEKFVRLCRNKTFTNLFFEEHGIEVPKQVDKLNPTFPLFAKPYDGSLSKDIFLIREQSELLPYHLEHPKLMFMEYIDPEFYEEFTVDAYYDRQHQLKCAVPRMRIFVRSGEINKGVTAKNELVDFLFDKLSHTEGAMGCLTIQFFMNSQTKRIVGIEINPRFGGGYPLSYLAGANYPKWILEEYLNDKEISVYNDWEDKLLMLRYDDEVLVRNYEG